MLLNAAFQEKRETVLIYFRLIFPKNFEIFDWVLWARTAVDYCLSARPSKVKKTVTA